MTKSVQARIEEKVSRAIRAIPQSLRRGERALKSGTVIVALKYATGIVIGADRNTIEGHKVFSHKTRKVAKVTPHSAIGGAGLVAMIRLIHDIYHECLFMMQTENGDMPIEAQAKLMRTIFQQLWTLSAGTPLEAVGIYAGFDPATKKKIILELDEAGADCYRETFAAIGSGGDEAASILRKYFRTHAPSKLNEESAIELAVEALIEAAEDVYVSDPRVYPPMLAIIDKSGYRELGGEKITKIARRIAPWQAS